MRRASSAVAMGMLVALLTACVPAPPEVVHPPVPPLACDEWAAPELIDALAGPDAVERAPELVAVPPHPFASDSMGRPAILQAGGMLCEWAPVGASPFEPTLQVSGLAGVDVDSFAPHQELERHNPGAVTVTEGAATLTVRCVPGYPPTPGYDGSPARCQWVAWSGDAVVEALIVDPPTSEYALPPVQPDPTQDFLVLDPVLDGAGARLVSGALEALLTVSDGTVIDDAPDLSCDDMIPPDDRVAAGRPFWVVQGGLLRDYLTQMPWGSREAGMLGALAQARLGWTRCLIYSFDPDSPTIDGIASAEMLLAPRAAWVIEGVERMEPREPTSVWAEASYTVLRGTAVVRLTTHSFGEKGLTLAFVEDVLAATRVP